jgi:hypothetical protein
MAALKKIEAAAGAGTGAKKSGKYVLVDGSDDETTLDEKTDVKGTAEAKSVKDGKAGELVVVGQGGYLQPGQLKGDKATVHMVLSKGIGSKRGKLKPITVTIPYSILFGTDAAGVSPTSSDVTPWSNTTEWAAWSTLYGEYKILRGSFKFGVWARQNTPPFQSQHLLAMGFDPVNAALPAGSRQITELSQHILLAPRLIAAGATVATDIYGWADGLHEFRYVIPSGPMAAATGLTYLSGQWSSTLAPIAPGAIKLYVQTQNLSTNIVIGINYVTVQFRSREM